MSGSRLAEHTKEIGINVQVVPMEFRAQLDRVIQTHDYGWIPRSANVITIRCSRSSPRRCQLFAWSVQTFLLAPRQSSPISSQLFWTTTHCGTPTSCFGDSER